MPVAACTDGDSLTYDVENRLTSVTKAGVTMSFVHNGDGTRVKKSVSNGGTTYYIGNSFEVYVSGGTTFNKYYYFGSQRVAARIANTLFYLQGDHLGSSSIAMTQSGTSYYSRQTYFPYGAQRTTEGSALPTDYTFTGQKNDDSTGLMFYGARYYDAALGRFTQPDTIVPSPLNPQSHNRFSYALNNPVRYTDPTGHMVDEGTDGGGGGGTDEPAEEEETEEETACAENDTDCDGVADDEETDTPADTGEEQGPDGDSTENGTIDPLLEATGSNGLDFCLRQNCFMGLSFSWFISTDWLDPTHWPRSTGFYFGGFDLLWIPNTGEFGLFQFGAMTESDYQGWSIPIQAGISLTGMQGIGISKLSDYEGPARSDIFGIGPIAAAGTQSLENPNLQAAELGPGWSFPIPLSWSEVDADWEMIWYDKE